MRIYGPVLGSLLLTLAGLARPARAQTFFGFASGNGWTLNSDLRLIQPATGTRLTFRNVTWNAATQRSAPYFNLRVGRYFRPRSGLGIEFNYTHFKAGLNLDTTVQITGVENGQPVNTAAPVSSRIQRLDLYNGVNLFGFNLLYRFPGDSPTPSFPRGRVQTYLGIGPTFFWIHNSNIVDGVKTDAGYQASGIGFEALFGVDYGLFKHGSLFVEGKYSDGMARLKAANGITLETPLRSMHLLLGFTYRL
jgi:opacity protein-like surface antigen